MMTSAKRPRRKFVLEAASLKIPDSGTGVAVKGQAAGDDHSHQHLMRIQGVNERLQGLILNPEPFQRGHRTDAASCFACTSAYVGTPSCRGWCG
jgi:hypothetical protein